MESQVTGEKRKNHKRGKKDAMTMESFLPYPAPPALFNSPISTFFIVQLSDKFQLALT